MPASASTRHAPPLARAAFALLCFLSPLPLAALHGHWPGQEPQSPQRNTPSPADRPSRGPIGHGPGQQHLSEWINQHRFLSPADQQRALDHEPGFRQLTPEVQQRMHHRLSELDSMPPAQRQRLLNRAEAIERLAPEQRQQVRGSMQQLSSLPPDQRLAVKRAFRQYRQLSPEQRRAALSSGELTGMLSPEERATFDGLVTVEPLLPPPPSAGARPRQQEP